MSSAGVRLRSRGGGTKVVVLRAWVGGGAGILSGMVLCTVWTVVGPVKVCLSECIVITAGWAGFIPVQARGSNSRLGGNGILSSAVELVVHITEGTPASASRGVGVATGSRFGKFQSAHTRHRGGFLRDLLQNRSPYAYRCQGDSEGEQHRLSRGIPRLIDHCTWSWCDLLAFSEATSEEFHRGCGVSPRKIR